MKYSATTHCLPPQWEDKPLMLSIGGSDSAALAGVQMDSRCAAVLNVHCSTAITATTAQTNEALLAVNAVPLAALASQIEAALAQGPKAIKIGMLANAEQVQLVARLLSNAQVPIVCDPVLATTSQGHANPDDKLSKALKKELFPLCQLITPNLPEAQQLLASKQKDMWQLARQLCPSKAQWVLLKGGHHMTNADLVTDYIHGPEHCFSLSQPRLATPHTRGTGCALASTIAALLAIGYEMRDALVIANMMQHEGLIKASSINGERGCLAPQGFPSQHWPVYAEPASHWANLDFPSCVGDSQPKDLGLYPIFDSVDWLARILPTGISTAQIRIKHLSGEPLRKAIQAAVDLAKQYHCRLFINDYWQLAIETGAYGVHLGQEDLQSADLHAISKAGLRLGISNHCHFEITRALAINPSYLACGPIYATSTKQMPWVPYGLEGLHYWRQALADHPLVAIAGIDSSNITAIAQTGVSGIALITAITKATDAQRESQHLKQLISSNRPAGIT